MHLLQLALGLDWELNDEPHAEVELVGDRLVVVIDVGGGEALRIDTDGALLRSLVAELAHINTWIERIVMHKRELLDTLERLGVTVLEISPSMGNQYWLRLREAGGEERVWLARTRGETIEITPVPQSSEG